MAMKDSRVSCAGCGAPLSEPSETVVECRTPCLECGSRGRNIWRAVANEAMAFSGVRHKQRRSGVARPILEGVRESQFDRSRRRWMSVIQIVDRLRNWYSKSVTDPSTGEVIRRCEQPLSAHNGRGSAFRSKRPDG